MPANLTFLPWVRQGAAGAITTVDSLGPGQSAVADVSIVLAVNNAALPEVKVRLRGPADVVGIDAHQIIRTDPRPGTSDFEPNCFPSIEFDRADFPCAAADVCAARGAHARGEPLPLPRERPSAGDDRGGAVVPDDAGAARAAAEAAARGATRGDLIG